MIEPPTDVAVPSWLWLTSNPPHGTVVAVSVHDHFAFRLDDQNSDGREIELAIYRRSDGDWSEIYEEDDAGLPDRGEWHGGGWFSASDGSGGYGWTLGREWPNALVPVLFAGERFDVSADADGWWLCVVESDEDEVPRRVRPRRRTR